MANKEVPSWLRTNKLSSHAPTLHEQQLRAEVVRLKEEVRQLKDALKVSANWADNYRKRCKQLELALKEGCGDDG